MSVRQAAAACLAALSVLSALTAAGATAGALLLEPTRVKATTLEATHAEGARPPSTGVVHRYSRG